jgi:hypothetical protein
MARHHREKYFFGAIRVLDCEKIQGREQLTVDDT